MTNLTFFQEVGDVGLELVPDADLPLIGQQGLLLGVVHQRVEEGILGNMGGWDGIKTARGEEWTVSVAALVCMCAFPSASLLSPHYWM